MSSNSIFYIRSVENCKFFLSRFFLEASVGWPRFLPACGLCPHDVGPGGLAEVPTAFPLSLLPTLYQKSPGVPGDVP